MNILNLTCEGLNGVLRGFVVNNIAKGFIKACPGVEGVTFSAFSTSCTCLYRLVAEGLVEGFFITGTSIEMVWLTRRFLAGLEGVGSLVRGLFFSQSYSITSIRH